MTKKPSYYNHKLHHDKTVIEPISWKEKTLFDRQNKQIPPEEPSIGTSMILSKLNDLKIVLVLLQSFISLSLCSPFLV